MTRLYYAAACQTAFPCPADRDGIAERTKRMCAIAEHTIVGYEPFHDVRLLAFPEFAHAAPVYDSVGIRPRKRDCGVTVWNTPSSTSVTPSLGAYWPRSR